MDNATKPVHPATNLTDHGNVSGFLGSIERATKLLPPAEEVARLADEARNTEKLVVALAESLVGSDVSQMSKQGIEAPKKRRGGMLGDIQVAGEEIGASLVTIRAAVERIKAQM